MEPVAGFMDTIMNFLVPQTTRNFLTRRMSTMLYEDFNIHFFSIFLQVCISVTFIVILWVGDPFPYIIKYSPWWLSIRSKHVGNKTGSVRITLHWSAFASHCCCGKAMNVTYLCMCVCARVGVCMRVRACSVAYPACNSYAPCFDVICGRLWFHHIFRHYLINGRIFEKKSYWT